MLTLAQKNALAQLKFRQQAKYIAILTSCEIAILFTALRIGVTLSGCNLGMSEEQVAQMYFHLFARLSWPLFGIFGFFNIVPVRAMTEKVHGYWRIGATILIGSFISLSLVCLLFDASTMHTSFYSTLCRNYIWLVVIVSAALSASISFFGLKAWQTIADKSKIF